MSTYTDASLIVTPNAVKAGKLYSVIPSNGAGDLDVVRATSATRVDENGLIEIPATNLALRSEEFNDVSWNKLALSVIVNSTTAPNGTNTADTILADGTNNTHRVAENATVVTGTLYTISVYAKKNTNNFLQIYGVSFPADFFANFNLDTGTIGTVGAGATATITNIGNGWYRCTATGTPLSIGVSVAFNLINSITSGRAEGSTLSTSVFLWGAQFEQGITATEYIPTTSVIRTRFAGITQDGSSASNIPRLDYTNASCPSILVEPQRTNLVFPSATATTQTRTVTATTHTLSFYGTGTVILSGVATGTLNGTGINNKVSLTFTPTAGTLILTVTGSVVNWQLEAGSNATSYIPTTTASVTRNADVISKSGLTGITTITETFEDDTTNVISGSPTSYTMSQGRIKNVIGI